MQYFRGLTIERYCEVKDMVLLDVVLRPNAIVSRLPAHPAGTDLGDFAASRSQPLFRCEAVLAIGGQLYVVCREFAPGVMDVGDYMVAAGANAGQRDFAAVRGLGPAAAADTLRALAVMPYFSRRTLLPKVVILRAEEVDRVQHTMPFSPEAGRAAPDTMTSDVIFSFRFNMQRA